MVPGSTPTARVDLVFLFHAVINGQYKRNPQQLTLIYRQLDLNFTAMTAYTHSNPKNDAYA
jgi:hypothetical protein